MDDFLSESIKKDSFIKVPKWWVCYPEYRTEQENKNKDFSIVKFII